MLPRPRGALVARLNPRAWQGRAFGDYGVYKSLGYAGGPLLGGVLVAAGGLRLLFAVLAVLAAAVAAWAALKAPAAAAQAPGPGPADRAGPGPAAARHRN